MQFLFLYTVNIHVLDYILQFYTYSHLNLVFIHTSIGNIIEFKEFIFKPSTHPYCLEKKNSFNKNTNPKKKILIKKEYFLCLQKFIQKLWHAF